MSAKKQRAPPPQPPPSSSSSSSEDEEEEEESSSSSDQEEQTNIPQPKPHSPIQDQQSEDEEDEDENHLPVKPTTSKNNPSASSSSSEDEEAEEESSSSSDQEEQTNIPQSKPDPPIQDQQSEDEADEDENHLPVKPTTTKKSEPKSEKKMAAPSKPPDPHNSKSKGKSSIVRFWSLKDEIAILRAMLDHQPPNNGGRIELNAPWVKELHDSIRKSLSVNADTAKLVDKMRKMKRKYIGASKRGDKLKLATDQDQTIYDLSDKIWGKKKEEDGFEANGNYSAATMSKGKSSKRDFPFIRDALGGGNRIALEMLETADVNKATALEKSFKKLKAVEINLIWKAYMLLR